MNEQSNRSLMTRRQVIGTVEIQKIGNSSVLSCRRMCLRGSISVWAISLSRDAGWRISALPSDPDFERTMEVARRGMKRYRNTLAELAK